MENVSGALEGAGHADSISWINSGAVVSNTVEALDSQVGQVIGNLNQVLTALASRSGDIDTLVDNLQTVSSSLAAKNTLLDSVVGNLSQVATDLANLIGSNHTTITNTIDNLQTVAADIEDHQQELANGLSTLGTGLAPYIQISQWGQWFAVQTIYTCLANQTVCPYSPADQPASIAPGPGKGCPIAGPVIEGHHARASPAPSGATAASSIGSVLNAVSGAGASFGARAVLYEGLHRAQAQGHRHDRHHLHSWWPSGPSCCSTAACSPRAMT